MPDTHIFSIITVVYDNIVGLKETARSIASNPHKSLEWIVIDGGSDDGTKDWLASTQACSWVSEPDNGIYDAMNKGIERSQGRYLLFLNAGDCLAAPDTLQNLAAEIQKQKTPPDFIYGDALETQKSGAPTRKPARPHSKITQGMFTHHQAMLYARDCIDDLRYNQHYEIAADYEFTARFLQKARSVLYYPAPLCLFEPGGVSQTNALRGRTEQFKVRRKLGASPFNNSAIFLAQTLLWMFRSVFPSLYWKFKSAGVSSDSSAAG